MVFTVCWSCKGGVGTTVVAALCALRSARSCPTVAVGLDGDLAATLGVPATGGDAGFGDWLRAGADAPADALGHLATPVSPGLSVVGPGRLGPDVGADSLDAMVESLRRQPESVIVDAGRIDRSPLAAVLARRADTSLLVTRRCYLALRRCTDLAVTPTGVIVVGEPGRALTVADVESVVGVAVVAEIAVDEGLARSVDAGLMTARLPRRLLECLDGVV